MTQAPSVHMEPELESADAPQEVQAAELPEAFDTGARRPAGQFDVLLDTAVEITAHLGAARLPARDVLTLGPGAVLTLDRQAGEPVDLILNGVRFATGHLVVVGDRLGIRLREILGPADQTQTATDA